MFNLFSPLFFMAFYNLGLDNKKQPFERVLEEEKNTSLLS